VAKKARPKSASSTPPPGRSGRAGAREATTTARLSLGKKAAFSLLALCLIGLVLEGALALFGVRAERDESDPSVGFSSQTPLFAEQRGPDGQVLLVTARNRLDFFNPQQFPKDKRAGTFRIFSLGGSTAYGHPYSDLTSFNGWLRALLPAVAPDRRWELVNAGGISYGSEREVRLMQELIHYQPDLFVLYCGHNEFLERRIHGQVTQTPGAVRELARLARHLRTATLIKRTLALLSRTPRGPGPASARWPDEPVTLLDNTRGPTAYTRESLHREEVYQQYRLNLVRMVDLARSVGARLVFVTPVSNLKEASPFKSERRPGLSEADGRRWLELFKRAREDYDANASPTNALAALAEAAAIDDLPAHLHFVRGRVLEKLGRFAEAKAAYERARDEDVCPLRAPTAIREILSQVAAERRVPLVDFAPVVEVRSEHGIPDANLFLDHVHLTIEGYRLLALEIIKTMEKEGIVHPSWDSAAIERVTQNVLGRIDTRAHSLALMNLCKTLGWAGKREEAYRAGAQAAKLGPDIAKVRYEAGLAAQLSNRPEEAIGHYRRALEREPTLGDAHCGLAVLLEERGQLAEAITHYRLAQQHGKPRDAERDRTNLLGALRKLEQQKAGPGGGQGGVP
jgi:tetratricopeptide (TPR) repeat protein